MYCKRWKESNSEFTNFWFLNLFLLLKPLITTNWSQPTNRNQLVATSGLQATNIIKYWRKHWKESNSEFTNFGSSTFSWALNRYTPGLKPLGQPWNISSKFTNISKNFQKIRISEAANILAYYFTSQSEYGTVII